MKKGRIIFIIFIILFIGMFAFIRFNSIKEINKIRINVSTFIDCVDDISDNKVQINWKNVAAIIGVIEKNNFKKVSENQIINISRMFINEKDELKSLDTVLDELDFNRAQKERTYKYIEDLKYYGLTPSKTYKDSKGTKFIESIKEVAIQNYNKYKILPSITIAQAILESNWGNSKLAREYNNLFGIKADNSWDGEFVTLQTTEYNGIIVNDKFRKYNDKNQSIHDHGKFLYENKRYEKGGVFQANTYKYQAKALQESGYSTLIDENGEKLYAKKLIQIIQQYNLQIIDSEVQSIK